MNCKDVTNLHIFLMRGGRNVFQTVFHFYTFFGRFLDLQLELHLILNYIFGSRVFLEFTMSFQNRAHPQYIRRT